MDTNSNRSTLHQNNGHKSSHTPSKSILRKEGTTAKKEIHGNEVGGGTGSKHVKFKKSKDVQQVSLRSKLNDWLETKGKTPTHCRHLNCFDAQMSAKKKMPKPVYSRLSCDVLTQQANILKIEETNSSKKLFGGTHQERSKSAKSPAIRQTISKPSVSAVKSNSKVRKPLITNSGGQMLTQRNMSRPDSHQQGSALKKELKHPRKKLFNESKPSKFLTPTQLTSRDSRSAKRANSCPNTRKSILAPSDISNRMPAKSPRVSFTSHTKVNVTQGQHDIQPMDNSLDVVLENAHPKTQEPNLCPPMSPSEEGKILENLKSMLEECITVFKDGCPVSNILLWLHEIDVNIPQAQTFAPYYVCKAQVCSADPQQVLEILSLAVERNAQPSDVIADAMRSLIPTKFALPQASPARSGLFQLIPAVSHSPSSGPVVGRTLTPVPSLQQQIDDSSGSDLGSTIKYSVIPIRRLPGQNSESVTLSKVTPIRRSRRFSNRQQTPNLKELDSVSDLTLREAEVTLFQPNSAMVE